MVVGDYHSAFEDAFVLKCVCLVVECFSFVVSMLFLRFQVAI